MIKSREDLDYYLQADREALGVDRKRPSIFGDEIWKLQRALRHQEYYFNSRNGLLNKALYNYYRYMRHQLAVRLGFTISINTCGPGLSIPHRGTIIVNDKARIGKNCRIHAGVNIGEHKGHAPVIGSNVYIGPGAKIIGKISIADEVKIGANAVVNKSVLKPGSVVVGVPVQRIINDDGN